MGSHNKMRQSVFAQKTKFFSPTAIKKKLNIHFAERKYLTEIHYQ